MELRLSQGDLLGFIRQAESRWYMHNGSECLGLVAETTHAVLKKLDSTLLTNRVVQVVSVISH